MAGSRFPELGTFCVHTARPASASRSITRGRLSVSNTLLDQLAPPLEHMPRALGECIEADDPVVGPRHLARHRHLAAPDHAHLGDGLVGGATRPGGDDGGAPPGEAGDAVDAGGGDGLGQGHVRQDRRQAPGQPRCPRPGRHKRKTQRSPRLHRVQLAESLLRGC